MMKRSNRDKLKKLEKIEEQRRARSRKYLEKQASFGKKQISGLIDKRTYDRFQEYKKDMHCSIGDALELIISRYLDNKLNVNIDSTDILTSEDTAGLTAEKIEQVLNEDPPALLPACDKEETLKDILINLPEQGTWKDRADKLNEKGIVSSSGKLWTAANLRMACKRAKQQQNK